MNLEDIFTDIYNNDVWNMGQNDSKSGLGSSDNFTKHIRKLLLEVIDKYNIQNMIDTSCGDLFWMKQILPSLNCNYTGIDIVKGIIDNNKKYSTDKINFKHFDFLEYLKLLSDSSN